MHRPHSSNRSTPLPPAADGYSLLAYLCQHSHYPRRKCFELIVGGLVTVNQISITNCRHPVAITRDTICINGTKLTPTVGSIYLKYNKPKNVITTMKDPKNRPHVGTICQSVHPTVFPVGRLDRDTRGLLLLTNDGQWANSLMHPRFEIPKQYRIIGESPLKNHHINQLTTGIMLEDGMAVCDFIEMENTNQFIITISEGRNRVIRRMLDHIGYPIAMLKRIAIGPILLGKLAEGRTIPLTARELRDIQSLIKKSKAKLT